MPADQDVTGYGSMSPEQRVAFRQDYDQQLAAMPAPIDTGIAQGAAALGAPLVSAGQGVDQFAQTEFPISAENAGRTPVRIAQGVGSVVPLAAEALAGPAAPALIAGTVGAQSYKSAFDQAKAAGADDDTAHQAATISAGANMALSELPGAAIGKAFQGVSAGLRGEVMQTLASMGQSGVVMTTYGQLQRLISNVAAKQTYAPDGNCYPPGLPASSGLHIDVDVANSPDPSRAR